MLEHLDTSKLSHSNPRQKWHQHHHTYLDRNNQKEIKVTLLNGNWYHASTSRGKIELCKAHYLTMPRSDIWYQQHFATQRSLKPKNRTLLETNHSPLKMNMKLEDEWILLFIPLPFVHGKISIGNYLCSTSKTETYPTSPARRAAYVMCASMLL